MVIKKTLYVFMILGLFSHVSFASVGATRINAFIGKVTPLFLDFLYEEDQKLAETKMEKLMPFFNWDSIFTRNGIVLDHTNRSFLSRACLLDMKHNFLLNKTEIEETMALGTLKGLVTEGRIEKFMSLISVLDPKYSVIEDDQQVILKWRGLTLYFESIGNQELKIVSWIFEVP